jgi:hypothetical protein
MYSRPYCRMSSSSVMDSAGSSPVLVAPSCCRCASGPIDALQISTSVNPFKRHFSRMESQAHRFASTATTRAPAAAAPAVKNPRPAPRSRTVSAGARLVKPNALRAQVLRMSRMTLGPRNFARRGPARAANGPSPIRRSAALRFPARTQAGNRSTMDQSQRKATPTPHTRRRSQNPLKIVRSTPRPSIRVARAMIDTACPSQPARFASRIRGSGAAWREDRTLHRTQYDSELQ